MMRRIIIPRVRITAAAMALLAATPLANAQTPPAMLVYFGSHGPQQPRKAGGGKPGTGAPVPIVAARFDPHTGALTALGAKASLQRPTWIVADAADHVLFSDNEIGQSRADPGQVVAFRFDQHSAALRELDRVGAEGGGTTFVAFDAATRTVFASNFNTGEVVAIPVLPGGRLGPVASVQRDTGSGPSPRQTGPHAHSVLVAPGHDFVLVPDMGADRVFIYRFAAGTRALTPAATPFVQFPPGTGPRHAVFAPDGRHLFVMTELSAQIAVFDWDAATGRATLSQAVDTWPEAPKTLATHDGAEIAIAADGRFLYSSTRSDNSLDVWSVDGPSGKLSHLQRMPSGGGNPWSFTIAPGGRWLLCTNEASNRVAVFAIDPGTGRLTATSQGLDLVSPVSATFVAGP